MMGKNNLKTLEKMESELRQAPMTFFECTDHQIESTMLEYKASFAYDKALDLCPYKPQSNKKPLNDALLVRILETIVAFANTKGGLLILGVGEKGREIVNQQQKHSCANLSSDDKLTACYSAKDNQKQIAVGDLRIYGIDHELEISENDFDQFQRKIIERLSLGSGKHQRKALSFRPVCYPCDSRNENNKISIVPSKSPDLLIGDIFKVSYPVDGDKNLLLGTIVVPPAEDPVTLRIEESNSQTVKYVLPVRKPGRTDLEEDIQRVLDFIQKRFKVGHAEEFVSGVLNQFEKAGQSQEQITEENLVEAANKFSQSWEEAGYPYYLVEKHGAQLKKFTLDNPALDSLEDLNTKAFLLMISIQFNAGWEKWTPRNLDNPIALKVLLTSLTGVYWRTRFRTLYALQFFDQKKISEYLAKNKELGLSEKTVQVLTTHCAKKTIVKFLKEVASTGQEQVSKKANEVLLEIASRWKDPDAGDEVPL